MQGTIRGARTWLLTRLSTGTHTVEHIPHDHRANIHPNLCVYADGTLIIVGVNTRPALGATGAKCIRDTSAELAKARLSLYIAKTESLVRNRVSRTIQALDNQMPYFREGNITIKPKETIVYLGVTLSPKLTSRTHLNRTVNRCLAQLPLAKYICHNTYNYEYKARGVMIQGYT